MNRIVTFAATARPRARTTWRRCRCLQRPARSWCACRSTFGPHTCIQRYLSREAFPGEGVCVTGANRSPAAYDNNQVAARVARASG